MNTKGALIGGAIGATAGGLGGFFTAHALRSSRKPMHAAGFTLGGAILLGGIGAYFGGNTASAAALTSGSNTVTTSFWNKLTPLQQQTYKSKLYDWLTSAVSGNTWPSSVESPDQAGITSLTSLDDSGNLALATDGYQTANSVGPGDGTIDQATYNAVTA